MRLTSYKNLLWTHGVAGWLWHRSFGASPARAAQAQSAVAAGNFAATATASDRQFCNRPL